MAKRKKKDEKPVDEKMVVTITFTKEEWRYVRGRANLATYKAKRPKGWIDSEWAMVRGSFQKALEKTPAMDSPAHGDPTRISLTYGEWREILYHMVRVPKAQESRDDRVGFLILYDRLEIAKGNYEEVLFSIEHLRKATKEASAIQDQRLVAFRQSAVETKNPE